MTESRERRQAIDTIRSRIWFEAGVALACVSAFFVALWQELGGTPGADIAVVLFIILSGITVAGFDGAREALRDAPLIADLVEREGAGARVEPLPFFMKGHYEAWISSTGAGGTSRFGFSFANSLLFGDKKSVYMLIVPLSKGRQSQAPARQPPTYRETGIGGTLEGREIEFALRPPRSRRPEWRIVVFLRPGRPITTEGLVYLVQRARAMGEAVARDGVGSVPWGTREKFRKLGPEEIGASGHVSLDDSRK
jgi:hypothetical protein